MARQSIRHALFQGLANAVDFLAHVTLSRQIEIPHISDKRRWVQSLAAHRAAAHLPAHGDGGRERIPDRRRFHLLRLALSALAGEKLSFLAAATLIVAPVAGLRASRSGVSFTLKSGREEVGH